MLENQPPQIRSVDGSRLPPVPARRELLPERTVGATGREWCLPCKIYAGEDSSPRSIQFGARLSLDSQAAHAACTFLSRYAPEEYARWREVFLSLPDWNTRKPRTLENMLPWSAERALILTEASTAAHAHPLQDRPPRGACEPPPERVLAPEIGPEHWYYKAHHNPGHGGKVCVNPAAAADDEVRQDIASLRSRLRRLDSLASATTGQALFAASVGQYLGGDTFWSFLQMCVADLRLPSHFLTLFLYGVGADHAMQQGSVTVWDPKRELHEGNRRLLEASHAVFNRLAEMYCEDFPRQPIA